MRNSLVFWAILVACMGFANDRIPIRNILIHFNPSSMAFQPDGRHLVLMRGEVLAIYDTTENRVSKLLGPQDFDQWSTSFLGTNGSLVAVSTRYNEVPAIALYAIDTGRLIARIDYN